MNNPLLAKGRVVLAAQPAVAQDAIAAIAA